MPSSAVALALRPATVLLTLNPELLLSGANVLERACTGDRVGAGHALRRVGGRDKAGAALRAREEKLVRVRALEGAAAHVAREAGRRGCAQGGSDSQVSHEGPKLREPCTSRLTLGKRHVDHLRGAGANDRRSVAMTHRLGPGEGHQEADEEDRGWARVEDQHTAPWFASLCFTHRK